MPRYWLQTLAAPKSGSTPAARVQRAADAVLWSSPYTNRQNKWIKHPHYATSHGKSATRTLGLGLSLPPRVQGPSLSLVLPLSVRPEAFIYPHTYMLAPPLPLGRFSLGRCAHLIMPPRPRTAKTSAKMRRRHAPCAIPSYIKIHLIRARTSIRSA